MSDVRYEKAWDALMRLAPLLVGAALIVVACGEDPAPAASTTGADATSPTATTTTAPATTATTEAAPATTTSVAETSATTSSTTTSSTLPATACPIPALLPEGTLLFAGGGGDYDGDGQLDTAVTYQAAPDSWRLRITFADGGGADTAISEAEDFAPPRPIGGFDIEGDGTDEMFVAVGAGASTVQIGLFDVAGCIATRVTEGGSAAVFPVGASIGNVSGLACPGDGTIQRIFAQYVDEDVYEGGFAPYVLEGAVLTAFPGDGAGFTAEEAFGLAVLDCGSLAIP